MDGELLLAACTPDPASVYPPKKSYIELSRRTSASLRLMPRDGTPYRTVTNYKVVLASVVAAGVGFWFLYIGISGGEQASDTEILVRRVADVLGGALLPIGIVVFIYELWFQRSMITEIMAATKLQAGVVNAGLRDLSSFDKIEWRKFFEENRGDVEIVLGYGRTWSAQHAAMVTRVVGSRGDRVKYTVLDPEAPRPLLQFYADTWGAASVPDLRTRIEEVRQTWREQVEHARRDGRRAHVVIEGVSRHVPFTFYRAGDAMWVVLAPRAPGRSAEGIPAFRCLRMRRDDALFEWVINDVEACRREGHARILEEMKVT